MLTSSVPTEFTQFKSFVELANRGLTAMYDSDRHLFCHRVQAVDGQIRREGISQRYTVMTLLGLFQAQSAGLEIFFDPKEIFSALTRNLDWIDNVGDIGLFFWLCAVQEPNLVPAFASRLRLSDALESYSGCDRSMEIAWLLTGLAHIRLANADFECSELAGRTFSLLSEMQGRSGAFGHLKLGTSVASLFRSGIGSFADQVYPIMALSKYAIAFGSDEALNRAISCAEVICREQGPLGQWWWHYDSDSGKAIGRYPVYSVHQHGMGPMALLALSNAAKLDFVEPITRGLNWISQTNELNYNMCDDEAAIIWRSIYQPTTTKYSSRVLAMLGVPTASGPLTVLHECRPYELGWLLYALAAAVGALTFSE